MKYMFQNSVQYMICLSANGCRNEPAYSDLWLKMVPFQFDTVLTAVVYIVIQKLEIELLGFFIH